MDGRLVKPVSGAQTLDKILQPGMITLDERPGPEGPENRPGCPRVEQSRDHQARGHGRGDSHNG